MQLLGFGFAGSLLAFLKYNFHPAKIFMGDTGSLMIGLVNGILVIKFIETAQFYPNHPITAAPAVGFGIILLPLMDTLRVFAIRIFKGRSPFTPDRNHIHHLLLDRGFQSSWCNVYLCSCNCNYHRNFFLLSKPRHYLSYCRFNSFLFCMGLHALS
ncbi:MAG: MraY family glycosyltransferase [Segetibacter sp.]